MKRFPLIICSTSEEVLEKMENYAMSTNGVTTATRVTTNRPRRNIYMSSLVIRVFIALVISSLIVMAFFITNVASH